MTFAELYEGRPIESPEPEDAELDRLQARLDELSERVRAAMPEGYRLDALIKASSEAHETEDVFDITAEQEALSGLSGPLVVPGKTPAPAFATRQAAQVRAGTKPTRGGRRRWLWVIALIILLAAAAALLFVGPSLA